MSAELDVAGLQRLRDGLAAARAGLSAAARVALDGALQVVTDYARPRIPTRTGAARGSLSVRVTDTAAQVTGGGARAPYFGWLDYGGRVGRAGCTVRRYDPQGRYLYPGLRHGEGDITAGADAAVRTLLQRAGLEVT